MTDEKQSLEDIYQRIGASLYRHALAIVSVNAEAEDLVHEAFTRLLDREQLERIDDLDAYLFRTVRNLALNRLRSARRESDRRSRLARPDYVLPKLGDPDESRAINAALAELAVDQREVVILRVYENLSFPEIAARVQAPLGTVYSRFRYALQRLRGLLGTQAS